MNLDVHKQLLAKHSDWFDAEPTVTAYAPGRMEILGNHTDYNEGFVLSAAIDAGCFFVCAPTDDDTCRLVAGDIMEEATFSSSSPAPLENQNWANYVIGVLSGLKAQGDVSKGFQGMFLSNVPLAAGLSSSAALEISAGTALGTLYGIDVPKLELARIGQAAEHEYAGVKCGLLDQISSLFGTEDALVMSDFRSLDVETIPMDPAARFLACNTRVKHTLVDSEYNERRAKCEEAAGFFASALDHPVAALRDVSWQEWERHSPDMDPGAAKRAAHVIGENARACAGRLLLKNNQLEEFGKLMFDSHESSQKYFENSCPELDFLVDTAKSMPTVLGARLSGGGFGGSIVALVRESDTATVTTALRDAYQQQFGQPCDVLETRPSAGACLVP
jgi:galactokinase